MLTSEHSREASVERPPTMLIASDSVTLLPLKTETGTQSSTAYTGKLSSYEQQCLVSKVNVLQRENAELKS